MLDEQINVLLTCELLLDRLQRDLDELIADEPENAEGVPLVVMGQGEYQTRIMPGENLL